MQSEQFYEKEGREGMKVKEWNNRRNRIFILLMYAEAKISRRVGIFIERFENESSHNYFQAVWHIILLYQPYHV